MTTPAYPLGMQYHSPFNTGTSQGTSWAPIPRTRLAIGCQLGSTRNNGDLPASRSNNSSRDSLVSNEMHGKSTSKPANQSHPHSLILSRPKMILKTPFSKTATHRSRLKILIFNSLGVCRSIERIPAKLMMRTAGSWPPCPRSTGMNGRHGTKSVQVLIYKLYSDISSGE